MQTRRKALLNLEQAATAVGFKFKAQMRVFPASCRSIKVYKVWAELSRRKIKSSVPSCALIEFCLRFMIWMKRSFCFRLSFVSFSNIKHSYRLYLISYTLYVLPSLLFFGFACASDFAILSLSSLTLNKLNRKRTAEKNWALDSWKWNGKVL